MAQISNVIHVQKRYMFAKSLERDHQTLEKLSKDQSQNLMNCVSSYLSRYPQISGIRKIHGI